MEKPPGVMRRAYRYLPVLLRGRPLHDEARYRPFFIIGSGRCGTTLLRAMLQTHPTVHIPPETYELGRIIQEYPRYSRLPWDELLRLILTRLEYNPLWDAFGISLRELYLDLLEQPREALNLAYVLHRFYMFHAKTYKPSAVRWGDKTPLNTYYLHEICSVFPDALFVHMIRDGRDVVRSYVELGRYSVREATDRWSRAIRVSREFGQQHPRQFMEVCYEDLVREPEMVLQRVCPFVQIAFDETMLRHHEFDLKLGDVEKLAHHSNVKNPINTRAIGKWRKYFSGDEIAEIEQALGPLLEEFGYQLSEVQQKR